MPIYLDIHSFSTVLLQDTALGKTKTFSFAASGESAVFRDMPKQSIANMFTIQFYYQQAIVSLKAEEYEDVEFYLDKVFAIDPDYPFARILRAQVHGALNKWKEAIMIYEAVLKSYPRLIQALQGAAFAYYETGEYTKALETFKIIAKHNPQWWQAYYWQGYTYYALGNYDMALELYHQALEILEKTLSEAKKDFFDRIDNEAVNKDRALIKNAIANVYIATGAYDLAASYLDQSLELDKSSAFTLLNSGRSYQMQGKLDKAIEQYQKILAVDKNSLPANWYMGKAYSEIGQYDQAIKFYEEALLLEPDNLQRRDIYFDLAAAYLQAKENPSKALFYFKNASALDPDNPKIKYGIATTYRFLEDYAQAEDYFKQAIEKDDTYAYAYRDLALLYFSRKEYVKAKTNFIKAKELFEAQGNSDAADELQPYIVFDPEKFPLPLE